jgi:prophage regulatory protein
MKKEVKIMAITHKNDSDSREKTEHLFHGNQQHKASESLLRERSVLARVELSRAYWRKLIAAKEAPAPIKIGKSSRWVASEIDAYIEARIAASRAKNAA